MEDFLQGMKFRELHDGVKIIYQNTHDVNNFFDNINFDNDFILISHNSDGKVTDNPIRECDANFNKKPKNLKKWFAQNVCVKDDILISLPIGLENSEWFVNIGKIELMKSKIKTEKENKNLLYINHSINTNPKERETPYKLFSDKNYSTCVFGYNGLDFNRYLNDIYNHKFVLCPEGNGTDTHRTWECLYMNTIPIEKRNINNSHYNDLPICFVDEWEEINEDFLNKEYKRIKNMNFNTEKLEFNFWKNKIYDYVRDIN